MTVSPPTMARSTGRRQCGQMVRVGSDAPCSAACLVATATRYPLVSGNVAENAENPLVAGSRLAQALDSAKPTRLGYP